MTPIKTFVLTPTPLKRYWLRTSRKSGLQPGETHWCDAHVLFGDFEEEPTHGAASDGRFPTTCDECGKPFGNDWEIEFDGQQLYRRSDNGELITWREAPAGAVLDAEWYHRAKNWCGDDGEAVLVRVPETPDGKGSRVWHVDGPCSNCTRKEDMAHKCWCRHGPLECLTVDKACNTCSAGGGSIWINMPDGFHGFLRNGFIVSV